MSDSSSQPLGAAMCRICLAETELSQDNKLSPDILISPCLCSGTVKWVHRGCLDRWRAENEGTPLEYRCELCHSAYAIETRSPGLLTYLWTQLSPWEKFFYFTELSFAVITVIASVKAAVHRNDSNWLRSSIFPRLLSSSESFLQSSPIVSVIISLATQSLPYSVSKLTRRFALSLMIFHHHLLHGSSPSSKWTIYMCSLFSFLAHIILFQKWQEENSEETVLNMDELRSKHLQYSMRFIR